MLCSCLWFMAHSWNTVLTSPTVPLLIFPHCQPPCFTQQYWNTFTYSSIQWKANSDACTWSHLKTSQTPPAHNSSAVLECSLGFSWFFQYYFSLTWQYLSVWQAAPADQAECFYTVYTQYLCAEHCSQTRIQWWQGSGQKRPFLHECQDLGTVDQLLCNWGKVGFFFMEMLLTTFWMSLKNNLHWHLHQDPSCLVHLCDNTLFRSSASRGYCLAVTMSQKSPPGSCPGFLGWCHMSWVHFKLLKLETPALPLTGCGMGELLKHCNLEFLM